MKEPVDAFAEMANVVNSSKRGSTVQLPIAFARSAVGSSPLANMAVGGRGGEVRLKLFLTLALQATRPPRTVRPRTSSYYSRLLNLDEVKGPKRVAVAMKWLEDHHFLLRVPNPGAASQVTLLSPDGSGSEWGRTEGPRWITLPIQLWSNGWIFLMTGRALACYVALRELTGGGKHPLGEYMDTARKRQYGFSDDTWTRATKDLEDLGLLTSTVQRWGDDQRHPRLRKRYLLTDLTDGTRPTWA